MQTPGRKRAAVTDLRSHLRFWITVAGGVGTDLVSKRLAWHYLGAPSHNGTHGGSTDLLPGWVELVTSNNPGVVFGIDFSNTLGPTWGPLLTILLTAATCGLVFYLFASASRRHWGTHILTGLVLAGAIGNLYDRAVYGHVRDFLHFTRSVTLFGRTFEWPYIFNVADIWLVAGVIGLVVASIVGPRRDARCRESDAETDRERSKA